MDLGNWERGGMEGVERFRERAGEKKKERFKERGKRLGEKGKDLGSEEKVWGEREAFGEKEKSCGKTEKFGKGGGENGEEAGKSSRAGGEGRGRLPRCSGAPLRLGVMAPPGGRGRRCGGARRWVRSSGHPMEPPLGSSKRDKGSCCQRGGCRSSALPAVTAASLSVHCRRDGGFAPFSSSAPRLGSLSYVRSELSQWL